MLKGIKARTPTTFFALLFCLFTALIFYMSSETAVESDGRSGGISEFIVTLLAGDSSLNDYELEVLNRSINSTVRIGGHIGEFLPLGITAALTALSIRNNKLYGYRPLLCTLICASVALADELYQISVPGRAFELFDIACDTLGAVLGIWLIFLLHLIFIKKSDQLRSDFYFALDKFCRQYYNIGVL